MKINYQALIILTVLCFEFQVKAQSSNSSFKKEDHQQEIFDTIINDPYRRLEDFKTDAKVQEYYYVQNIKAEQYFYLNPLYKSVRSYLKEIDKKEIDLFKEIQTTEQGDYFILKRKGEEDKTSNLYLKRSGDTIEKRIFNPTDYSTKTKRYSISSFKPSWDGKYVAVAIKKKGSFTSEILVLNLSSNEIKKTNIENSRPNEYYGIHWIPYQYKFSFTELQSNDVESSEIKVNSSLSIYDVVKEEKMVVFNKASGFNYDEKYFPVTKVHSSKDRNLIVSTGHSGNHWNTYFLKYKDLSKGKLKWSILLDSTDYVERGSLKLKNSTSYYIESKPGNKRRLIAYDISNKTKKVLVQDKKDEIIQDFILTKNNVYYTTTKYGINSFLYKYDNQTTTKVELPIPGNRILINNQNIDSNNFWVNIYSPMSEVRRFKYSKSLNEFTEEYVYTHPAIEEFKNINFKTVEVESHDGTLVPMTIVYNNDIVLDGNNPLLSYSYGAFAKIDNISFKTHMLSYVSMGGVLAYPHIRGGGAKGEDWHRDGMKEKKRNSWLDLSACIDYLIKEKYTSRQKITLLGGSAGAIPIAMAINENPNIVAAAVMTSAVLNPYRREEIYNTSVEKEYGSLKIQKEAYGLIDMDPYLNIPKESNFPSIFLKHGLLDDRVYLHETLKYYSRINEYNTGANPIILDVVEKGTHTSVASFYTHWAKIFSFSFKETNHIPRL